MSGPEVSVLVFDPDKIDRDIICASLLGSQVSNLWPGEKLQVAEATSARHFNQLLSGKSFDIAVIGLQSMDPLDILERSGFLDNTVAIPTIVCVDFIDNKLLEVCSKKPLWTVIDKTSLVPRLRDAVHYLAMTASAQNVGFSGRTFVNSTCPLVFGENQDGYMVLDQVGEVLYSNRAARQLLGRTNLSKENCGFLFEEKSSAFQIKTAGREVGYFSSPLLVDHKLVYLVRLEDITWHKKAEEQLDLLEKSLAEKRAILKLEHERVAELEQEVQQINRAKEGFFASISHEIRTPLSSVLGYAEALLADDSVEDETKKGLSVILTSGDYLLQLLNNALDISKLEAGKLQTKRESCCVVEVVEDVLDIMRIRAEEKGLKLNVNLEYPLPSKFFSDFTRLKQILCNLIGNAIKFTELGSISLNVSYDAGYDELVFEVVDTGLGVPIGQRRDIFEVYHQSTATPDSAFGGSGLGLPLSKRLAICLGGDVSFRPNKPTGSIFTCSIQAGIDKHVEMLSSAEISPKSESSAGQEQVYEKLTGKILLVEDYEFTRSLARMFISGFGLDVVEAVDGLDAIEKVQAEKFDLVLMDMRMPRLDGYGAVHKLRESGYKTPIIAFTANTYTEEIKRTKEVGCDDYLAKPFSRVALYRIMKSYLGRESATGITFEISSDLSADKELNKVIKKFQSSLDDVLQEVVDAWSGKDTKQLKSLAHRLKAAHAFGFKKLSEEARIFESRLSEASEKDFELFVDSIREARGFKYTKKGLKQRVTGNA